MSWQSKRLVFAGGADWSVEFLTLLCEERFKIVGVLAPPDGKKGRGCRLSVHPLKAKAEELGIPVWQPPKLNDPEFLSAFKKIKPDLVVVAAYGKLFPSEILAIPPQGFVNFHPSLLPKLRGPSPIQSAILEGFTETGVSIMKLGEGMDDGPVLAQKTVKIDSRETGLGLTRKLVALGQKMLPEILKRYLVGEIMGKGQDDNKATYCKMLRKEDGRIDWQNQTAEEIDRKVRALNPQVRTFTFIKLKGQPKRLNILESAGVLSEDSRAGQHKLLDNKLAVGTKKNLLLVSKLQLEGKKPVLAKEFIQGYGLVNNFLSL